MSGLPPTPVDYETPATVRRDAWRGPVLVGVVLVLLGGAGFCIVPVLMLKVGFPVPSDPPVTRPGVGLPTTTVSGSPTTAESE